MVATETKSGSNTELDQGRLRIMIVLIHYLPQQELTFIPPLDRFLRLSFSVFPFPSLLNELPDMTVLKQHGRQPT